MIKACEDALPADAKATRHHCKLQIIVCLEGGFKERADETNHLILRVCVRRDAMMVLDFYKRNFEDFAKYEPLSYPQATQLRFHEEILQYEYDSFLKGRNVRFYFFEKENPLKIVGTASYRNITGSYYSSCQLGYKMDRDYRRKGYMHEALELGNRVMFREMSMHRIEAIVMPDNTASIALLEGLGFEREGLLRDKIYLNGRWEDHYQYALLNPEG